MQKLTDLRDVNSSYNSNLTFHFPISIVVKRCVKEKLTSAMRDLGEKLEICLSCRQ